MRSDNPIAVYLLTDLAVDVDVPVGQLGEGLAAVAAAVGSLVPVKAQVGPHVEEFRESLRASHTLEHLLHAASLRVVHSCPCEPWVLGVQHGWAAVGGGGLLG